MLETLIYKLTTPGAITPSDAGSLIGTLIMSYIIYAITYKGFKKTIVGKSITIIIAIAITSYLSFIGSGGNYDLTRNIDLENIAKNTKARILADGMRLDGATAINKTITFHYTFTKILAINVDTKIFLPEMKKQTLSMYCKSPASKLFIENNIISKYLFLDKEKTTIGNFIIIAQDCKNLK